MQFSTGRGRGRDKGHEKHGREGTRKRGETEEEKEDVPFSNR